MSKPEIVEALDIHAEGLKEGMDLAPVLLEHTGSDDPHLTGLLSLAAQVKSVLVPVEPRPKFATDLRAKLLANVSQARRAKVIRQSAQERKVVLGALAGVGGLLYAVSLAFMGLRMMFTLVSVGVALLGWLIARPGLIRSRRAR